VSEKVDKTATPVSPSHRHAAKSAESFHARIRAHIERHLGPVTNVFRGPVGDAASIESNDDTASIEPIDDAASIDVQHVASTKTRPIQTLITAGMSDLPMPVPANAESPRYLELMMTLPESWKQWDWKAPVAVVATIALCYVPYLSIGRGVFGFLTTGYLSEESHTDGNVTWPLAAWRWLAGQVPGDYVVYLAISAMIIAGLSILAASRDPKTPRIVITDVARLLMAFLLLLSPHYPWYFLVLTPFVALIGGAPLWAVTLGALLLQEEIDWDFFIPVLTRKSALYGMFFAACAYVAWQAWRRKNAATMVERGVIQPD